MNFKLLLFLSFVTTNLFSQERSPKDYVQKIDGSEYVIPMVWIPKGKFKMGSPADENKRREDEGPVHTVEIAGFWMSQYEITWELYKLFLNREIDTVSKNIEKSDIEIEIDAISGATIPYVDMSLGMGTDEGKPVVNITHHAASKFCKWLSAKTGHFYRLPTEAEWEYAARAGTNTAYYFGDNNKELDKYAWYYANSNGTYHKVGQKESNPWGLYDMYGNVAEWTLDQYLPKAYQNRNSITKNPIEFPIEEYPRSVRGGSYLDDNQDLRSASRMASTENWKMRDPQFPKSKWWNTDAPFVGFRVVRIEDIPSKNELEKYWGEETP
ncbi:formylglycine-generating enzyme family protein [Salegentibacter maritimus]|uniref:formylglycine-generating enzyme family protein n=1 Tax=Salegentibacter maritimus TaxID=2794347 RepID=UPI0018E42470|nr:formylglycine-generating enzyme family protein [Salegentibacter maritimus]MBI6118044.1 formylglycine-generating enzyme family protein [Salegentibacter maritimus]